MSKLISKFKSINSATGSYNSTKKYNKPLFNEIEKNAMKYEGMARNPVIVIHGFLGSRLEDDQTKKCVWGDFYIKDLITGYSDKELRDLSHPMEIGKSLPDLRDSIHSVDMMNTFNLNLLGFNYKLDAYDKMISILEFAGYTNHKKDLPKDKNFHTLFTFNYDWRMDLPYNAAKLFDFITQTRKDLKEKYLEFYGIEDYNVQFDIMGHSMGGLLARYFLRFGAQDLPEDGSIPDLNWKGSEYVDKLIIIGTPNAGYLDTCLELVNGLQIAKHTPFYPSAVVGTFPTYYQMMPLLSTRSVVYSDDINGEPVDIFDIQVWKKLKWGLANPDQRKILQKILPDVNSEVQREKIALDHLEKCLKRAKQFIDAMRIYGDNPKDVSKYLFVGSAVETHRRASVDRTTGKLKVIEHEAGDGKVLTASALMDEREGKEWEPFLISPIEWRTVIHLEATHMEITESYSFADNIIYILLISQTEKQKKRRSYLVKRRDGIRKFKKDRLEHHSHNCGKLQNDT